MAREVALVYTRLTERHHHRRRRRRRLEHGIGDRIRKYERSLVVAHIDRTALGVGTQQSGGAQIERVHNTRICIRE